MEFFIVLIDAFISADESAVRRLIAKIPADGADFDELVPWEAAIILREKSSEWRNFISGKEIFGGTWTKPRPGEWSLAEWSKFVDLDVQNAGYVFYIGNEYLEILSPPFDNFEYEEILLEGLYKNPRIAAKFFSVFGRLRRIWGADKWGLFFENVKPFLSKLDESIVTPERLELLAIREQDHVLLFPSFWTITSWIDEDRYNNKEAIVMASQNAISNIVDASMLNKIAVRLDIGAESSAAAIGLLALLDHKVDIDVNCVARLAANRKAWGVLIESFERWVALYDKSTNDMGRLLDMLYAPPALSLEARCELERLLSKFKEKSNLPVSTKGLELTWVSEEN